MSTYERELAYFDSDDITVTQYAGEIHTPTGNLSLTKANKNAGSCVDIPLSHQGYRATDIITTSGILTAPFKVNCLCHRIYENKSRTFTEKINGTEKSIHLTTDPASMTVLESANPVRCANGTETYLTLVLFHCNDLNFPEAGKTYEKG